MATRRTTAKPNAARAARRAPSRSRSAATRSRATARPTASKPFEPRALWLAGVALAARARKQGEASLAELLVESRHARTRTLKLARRVATDMRGQVDTLLTPVRKRVRAQLRRAETMAERSAGRVLARIGVPSKGDIDALIARIDALSKQMRATKHVARR